MKPLTLGLIAVATLSAQHPDFYPQIHALVLEAEALSVNMRVMKDRSNPHVWAGDILAHAGYLDDAERAYRIPPKTAPPYNLWRGWVVYGQRERAEKAFDSTADANRRASFLASLADILWRTGHSEEAREKYKMARADALLVGDVKRLNQLLVTIDQGLEFVSDPPPELITPTPHPRPRAVFPASSLPPFPISVDGFGEADPSANRDLRVRLAARAAAGDQDGIEAIAKTAVTPFQKALCNATIEQILLQDRKPEQAEQSADRIPDTNFASTLAKAEGLSAAATAWLREGNEDRARADFDNAVQIVLMAKDVAYGRIPVLQSIAAAQLKGGLRKDGEKTLRSAIELTVYLPVRPIVPLGTKPTPPPPGTHYQDEAFGNILRTAIQARDVLIASEIVDAWRRNGENGSSVLAAAWLAEGKPDEAIAAVRRVPDPEWQVTGLLSIARTLLDEAGAPAF